MGFGAGREDIFKISLVCVVTICLIAKFGLTLYFQYGTVVREVSSVPREMSPTAKRPRISIDVDPEIRRRIRVAAAQKDLLVSQYVLEAIKERLWQDLGEQEELDSLLALNAKADPLLADLWNNKKDAAYDRL